MTLLELLGLLRKHMALVVILPIVCAVGTAAFAWLALPNVYTASTTMYVLTRSSDTQAAPTNGELSASQMLTNDVAKLVKTNRVARDAAAELGMSSLDDYKIDVKSDTSTRVITVSVTGESAHAVALIANSLAGTTDSMARELMDAKSVNVLEEAEEPSGPSGPPRVMYTAVAFLAGIFLAVAIVVLMDMLNTRVRSPEEAAEMLGLPVVGRIPVIKGR